MDPQRQQYIPGPPPPQNPLSHLPPPPPRSYPQQAGASNIPPPPPGPYPSTLPPGSVYGFPAAFQPASWVRPGMGSTLPPPPPMNYAQMQNQKINYGPVSQRPPGQLNIPPPPPQNDKPVLSATFIPGGDSFGPGVGIPPFEDYSYGTFSAFENFYASPPADQSSETFNKEARSESAASHRAPGPLALRNASPISPGPPTATLHNPQTSTGHTEPSSVTTTNRQRAQSAAVGARTADVASQWPIERVCSWLAANNFSMDWQDTFRVLKLEGSHFLELAQGGHVLSAKLYSLILPKLAQVCTASDTGWDQGREREEGRRLRRLLNKIADGTDSFTSTGPGHKRRESNVLASASTDGTVESSPSLATIQAAAGPFDSPGKQLSPALGGSFGPRGSQGRSSTMPVYSKQANSTSTLNDVRNPDSSNATNRPDTSRSGANGITSHGRHSPGLSGDGFQGLGLAASPGASPHAGQILPAPHSAGSATAVSRGDHSKSNSIDSDSKYTGASFGIGTSAEPNTSARYYEYRRDVQELSKLSPTDNRRAYSNEGSVKEHKGLLNRLRFRRKDDAEHDGPLESPTSPVSTRFPMPFTSRGVNGSDSALVQRPSSGYDSERLDGRTRKPSRGQRRFIFVTPDHWNYRLIDVTDLESAIQLRSHICMELGVLEADTAQVFVTEPGKSSHDEPLNDSALVSARMQADAFGSLKFYVQGNQRAKPTSTQGIMYGADIPKKAQALLGVKGETMIKSNSTGGVGNDPGSGTPEALDKAAERWRRETSQKGKKYQERRQPPVQTQSIRGSRVVDFDSPRVSPYEEKKMENLVPLRRPPTAPSESSTLTKVNSLRKSQEKNRTSMDSFKRISDPIFEDTDRGRRRKSGASGSTGAIGAAIANAGKVAGAPAATAAGTYRGTPTTADQGGFTSPDYTWSKGEMLFRIPSYDGVSSSCPNTNRDPANSSIAAQQPRKDDNSPVSPASEVQARPPMPRVKSYGPDMEFKETHVSFNSVPASDLQSDSDDDSDDGLFAIPLANKPDNQKGDHDAGTKDQRPTLTVDTDQKSRKTRSVTFQVQGSADGHANDNYGDESAGPSGGVTRSYSEDSAGYSGSAVSPEPDRGGRPKSFVSDIWANRPAVENVVDHLDQFFPGVDLDKPYLEENPDAASPATGAGGPGGGPSSTTRDRTIFGPDNLRLRAKQQQNENDTLGSDESTLKDSNKDKFISNSHRQTQRASIGLGRMKSVREVARKRNRDVVRAPSVPVRDQTQALTQKETNLMRRKSTKMWGANIVQIKPERSGNRLSTLDPIPQEDIPSEDSPQRQATFKIIRGQLIGKGTYGRVYLGMNATTGEFLAVKQVEVNQKAAGSDRDRIKEMVAALDQEIDTMKDLEHPNIVQYLGCERKEFSISIYLEYIPGGSIGSCLRKHGKFEESVVRSLTQQTLKGLAYLHHECILHRDLKADNILLDLDGTCKISDFGISKKSSDIYINDATNSMQGSVFWMAPEVVRAQGQGYSAKVDIWSLGCVVLEMYAGTRPWSRDEAIGAIFKLGKLNQAPPIPEDVAMTASVSGVNFMYDCFQV